MLPNKVLILKMRREIIWRNTWKIFKNSLQEMKGVKSVALNKKKTISLIKDHQKRLSENHETINNREDEIHAIEKIIPLLK